jgi:hypothetical protein
MPASPTWEYPKQLRVRSPDHCQLRLDRHDAGPYNLTHVADAIHHSRRPKRHALAKQCQVGTEYAVCPVRGKAFLASLAQW